MSDTFFLVVGIILSLIGLIILISIIAKHIGCSMSVDADIINVESNRNTIRGSTYYTYTPVIKYNVNSRECVNKIPTETRNQNKYVIGSKLKIRVNPSNPDDFAYKTSGSAIFFGLLFLALGAILVVCFFL